VLELPQDLNLSVGTLRISGVLKSVKDLLKSVCFFGVFFLDLPDVPVRARTHLFKDVESSMDVILDEGRLVLITHRLSYFNFIS
jgi:hypothetical protein